MKKFKIQIGMFLVVTLLLTSVLTATGIVMLKVTSVGKQVSDNYVSNIQLINSATMSTNIIDQAMNSIMNSPANTGANIYYVDTTVSPKRIYSPLSTPIDLNAQLFTTNPPTTTGGATSGNTMMTLIAAPPGTTKPQGTFGHQLQSLSVDTVDPAKAWYAIKISATVYDSKNGFQQIDRQVMKSRTCPPATNTNHGQPILMQPVTLTPADLTTNSLTNQQYQYPNLFCSCYQTGFNKTMADGSCSQGTCPPGSGLNSGICAVCPTGKYSPGGTSPCLTCPSGYYCTNGNKTLCPSGVGWTIPSNSGNCQCDNDDNGHCISCPVNQFLSMSTDFPGVCIACSSGYYSLGGIVNQCTACSSTGCSVCTGPNQCTTCSSGYYLSGNTCVACPANATCSNNNINCNSGYSLRGNVCTATCPANSSTTGTGQSVGSNGCKCTDNTFYANSSGSCSSCLPNSSTTGLYDQTKLAACKCNSSSAPFWNFFANSYDGACQACPTGSSISYPGVSCCSFNFIQGSFGDDFSGSESSTCKCPTRYGNNINASGNPSFLDGYSRNVCIECPVGCSTCQQYGGFTCFSCEPGYTLPTGCALCTAGSSGCTLCKDGFYLTGSNCLPCPDHANCFNNNITCISGYYFNSATNSCIYSPPRHR